MIHFSNWEISGSSNQVFDKTPTLWKTLKTNAAHAAI